ncbi:MAG: NAD+ synthase [Deltaproteobacteria bacterium]|nr:NAD+ synthase [Deltaproteobacteria bacterium]MBW1915069.1 NAD+ synthase [Deltaproteobacteria bacterium]
MKIAICQTNPIIGDFKHNKSLILEAVGQAKTSGCSLVVFPELSIPGYPPKDLLGKPAFVKDNIDCLNELASQATGITLVCGFVDVDHASKTKSLFNSAALIRDGRVIDRGGKRLLPSYDVFDETRYFKPAPKSLIFELEGKSFGVTICEDIWNIGSFEGLPRYETDPVAELIKKGVDILLNISASPYTLNKPDLRTKILKSISKNHMIPAVYCNQVGGNDDLLFDGGSMVTDRLGRVIIHCREFKSDMVIWDTEKEYSEIKKPFDSEEETVLQGLIMGTRDYASKCGFKKVLIGLSGGIDSSLVAVIAQKALGPKNVTGVSMPSSYTSAMSRKDARKLSENLGIHFKEIPISTIFDSYKTTLAPIFQDLEENETEENIQARIRGNLLMALSNKFNALLLTTGNKSETAVGYCTLYGDMSGGLAVISDIPKTMCYRIARHINRNEETIPDRIITRPPSAELRPDQTDQDTLPPYEVLDSIIEAAVEKNLSYEEITAMGYEPDVVKDVLRRIMINEYKRLQAPPGLKVTSKAFGYGRRLPIAKGGKPY